MVRGILDRTCPTCGVEIGFGLAAHVLECAPQKGQRGRAKRRRLRDEVEELQRRNDMQAETIMELEAENASLKARTKK